MYKNLVWMTALILTTACTILLSDANAAVSGYVGTSPVINSINLVIPDVVGGIEITGQKEVITEVLEPASMDVVQVEQKAAEGIVDIEIPEITPEPMVPVEPIGVVSAVVDPVSYNVQQKAHLFVTNFAHPEAGCAWQGVAGQVLSKTKEPVTNLIIKVSGLWNGNLISNIGLTGMLDGQTYGTSGYEIILGNEAVKSKGELQIQVFDMEMQPVSKAFTFNTSADCSKNLVLINFSEE